MWSGNSTLSNPILFATRNQGNGCIVLVFVLFGHHVATNASMTIQKFELTNRQMYLFNQKRYDPTNNGEFSGDLQLIEDNIGNIEALTEKFGTPQVSPI